MLGCLCREGKQFRSPRRAAQPAAIDGGSQVTDTDASYPDPSRDSACTWARSMCVRRRTRHDFIYTNVPNAARDAEHGKSDGSEAVLAQIALLRANRRNSQLWMGSPVLRCAA
jgi:hypothetical protein